MTKIQPFSAEVRRAADLITIDLHGEVDAFADRDLQTAYAEAEAFLPAVIALNFSDVSYINSTGIALIVNLLSRSRKANRRVIVYGLSDHYVTIFQITRLSDFMTIFPDEAAALEGLTQTGG